MSSPLPRLAEIEAALRGVIAATRDNHGQSVAFAAVVVSNIGPFWLRQVVANQQGASRRCGLFLPSSATRVEVTLTHYFHPVMYVGICYHAPHASTPLRW